MRRCVLAIAGVLLFAPVAVAQQAGATLLPRAAFGVMVVQGTDRLPPSTFTEFTHSSAAPGLWADVTLVEKSALGLHVGLEIQEWVEHGTSYIGPLGGPFLPAELAFKHKDYVVSSFISWSPGEHRIRPVWLAGAGLAESRYFVLPVLAPWREKRTDGAAALVGLELPLNLGQRVAFIARFHGRVVAWPSDARSDGFSALSFVMGAGVQVRLR